MEAGDAYTSHMEKYPIINLSLKSGKQPNFQMEYECIIDEISKEYARHIYILDNKKLIDIEKVFFFNILNKKAKDSDYAKAIQFLSNCLEKYYEKKVIILIDEYDVPIENAFFEFEEGNPTHIPSLGAFEKPNHRFGLSQHVKNIL